MFPSHDNVDAISSTPQFDFSFATEMITFTNSNILLKTSFGSDNIYEKIIENAKTISQMYGTPQADGYAEHYSKANAYVLIPAFQASISVNGNELVYASVTVPCAISSVAPVSVILVPALPCNTFDVW